MSDDIEVTDKARQAAFLAVLASGSPTNQREWRRRVQHVLPTYAALVRDDYGFWGKEAQGIIDAEVFTGAFQGAELEESSKRLIVKLASLRDGEVETIRTERTDTPPGWVMKERLDALEIGTEIAAFKKIEAMRGSKDRKVRVLVHFEPLRSKKSTTASSEAPGNRPSQPPAQAEGPGPSSSEPTGDSPVSPVGSDAPSASAHAVQLNMEPLSARQRLAVKNRCVGEQIADWADPGPESIDRVLTIIKEVAQT